MIRFFARLFCCALVVTSFALAGCDTGAGKGATIPKGTYAAPTDKPSAPTAPSLPPSPPK